MRRLAVFILLAAVFSMHGIPVLGADDATGSSGNVSHAVMVSVHHDAPVADVAPGPEPVDGAAQLASGPPGQPAPAGSEGMDAHVWGACLAIIFAGIALLTVIVVSRGRSWFSTGWTASRAAVTRLRWAPSRPPDLSVLCLLRI